MEIDSISLDYVQGLRYILSTIRHSKSDSMGSIHSCSCMDKCSNNVGSIRIRIRMVCSSSRIHMMKLQLDPFHLLAHLAWDWLPFYPMPPIGPSVQLVLALQLQLGQHPRTQWNKQRPTRSENNSILLTRNDKSAIVLHCTLTSFNEAIITLAIISFASTSGYLLILCYCSVNK